MLIEPRQDYASKTSFTTLLYSSTLSVSTIGGIFFTKASFSDSKFSSLESSSSTDCKDIYIDDKHPFVSNMKINSFYQEQSQKDTSSRSKANSFCL